MTLRAKLSFADMCVPNCNVGTRRDDEFISRQAARRHHHRQLRRRKRGAAQMLARRRSARQFQRPMPDAIRYVCQRCTNCCRWPGFVKLEETDIAAIAQFLGVPEFDFIQRYTRLRQYRDGLALTEKPGGECVFLDGHDCSIQPVKPGQCRGFPNDWNFPGWRDVCEAIAES